MAEETLHDSEAMRRFAGIELGDDRIPDETTILNFRHMLERHGLTEAIFAEVNAHLADKGITLRSGTQIDATIIDAPSSTKNKARARDPEMSSTKKGNDWYFGSEEDQKSIQRIDVTDAVLEEVREWQSRALDRMYPIVMFDALRVKIRDADSRMVKIEPWSAIGPRTMARGCLPGPGRHPRGSARGPGDLDC